MNIDTQTLLIIAGTLVAIGLIISQTIVRWRETGSYSQTLGYMLKLLEASTPVKQGAISALSMLDDATLKHLDTFIQTIDPLTDVVPGDWDNDMIDYISNLVYQARMKQGTTSDGSV